jgi:hypothetical protein
MRTVAKEGLHGRGLVSGRSMEDRTVTSHPQSGIVKLQGGDGPWYHVVALPSALLALRAAACFSRATLLSSLVLFFGFFSSSGFFPVFGLSFGCFVAAFGAVWRFFFQFVGSRKEGRKEGRRRKRVHATFAFFVLRFSLQLYTS